MYNTAKKENFDLLHFLNSILRFFQRNHHYPQHLNLYNAFTQKGELQIYSKHRKAASWFQGRGKSNKLQGSSACSDHGTNPWRCNWQQKRGLWWSNIKLFLWEIFGELGIFDSLDQGPGHAGCRRKPGVAIFRLRRSKWKPTLTFMFPEPKF